MRRVSIVYWNISQFEDKNVLLTDNQSQSVPSSQVKKSKLIAVISRLFTTKDSPCISLVFLCQIIEIKTINYDPVRLSDFRCSSLAVKLSE